MQMMKFPEIALILGRSGTQYVTLETKMLSSYCGAPLAELYCQNQKLLTQIGSNWFIKIKTWRHPGVKMFPDCLPVSSDRQNIFSPVSTKIQLEQYYFKMYFHQNYSRPSFHFSLNFNTRTLLNFVIGVSKFSSTCSFWASTSLANCLCVKKTIQIELKYWTHSRLIGEETRKNKASYICCLCHVHCKDCIILLLLGGVW